MVMNDWEMSFQKKPSAIFTPTGVISRDYVRDYVCFTDVALAMRIEINTAVLHSRIPHHIGTNWKDWDKLLWL